MPKRRFTSRTPLRENDETRDDPGLTTDQRAALRPNRWMGPGSDYQFDEGRYFWELPWPTNPFHANPGPPPTIISARHSVQPGPTPYFLRRA